MAYGNGGSAPTSYPGLGGMQSAQNAALVDESPSKIRDVIGGSEDHLRELLGAIDGLEKRLDTVLTPVPPTPNQAAQGAPVPTTAHLTARLMEHVSVMALAIQRIRDITRRIEV